MLVSRMLLRKRRTTAVLCLLVAVSSFLVCASLMMYQTALKHLAAADEEYVVTAVPARLKDPGIRSDPGQFLIISGEDSALKEYATRSSQRRLLDELVKEQPERFGHIGLAEAHPAVQAIERRMLLSAYAPDVQPFVPDSERLRKMLPRYSLEALLELQCETAESIERRPGMVDRVAVMKVLSPLVMPLSADDVPYIRVYLLAGSQYDLPSDFQFEPGATYIARGFLTVHSVGNKDISSARLPLLYLESIISIPGETFEQEAAPPLMRLEGSAKDLLASPQGDDWREVARKISQGHHALLVLTSDYPETIFPFHQRRYWLTEGRLYSAKEAKEGAHVCLITKALADQNGLKVGDALPLAALTSSASLSLEDNEARYSYSIADDALQRAPSVREAFTIVGIYHGPLQDGTLYGLEENAVIIPQTTAMAYADPDDCDSMYAGNLYALKLYNKEAVTFVNDMSKAGVGPNWNVFDQGYAHVAEQLETLSLNALVLFGGSALAFILIVCFYYVMMSSTAREAAGFARAQGAGKRSVFSLLFWYQFAVAGVGLLLGSAAAIGAQKSVADVLLSFRADSPEVQETMFSNLSLTATAPREMALTLQQGLSASDLLFPLLLLLLFASIALVMSRCYTKAEPLALMKDIVT